MKKISYKDIDEVLLPWSARHNLHVYTECKDEETRDMIFMDQWGDQYEIYAIPDYETGDERVAVGADLCKRGDKNYHAFYRERKEYHFRTSVDLPNLANALDGAWKVTQQWGAQFHAGARKEI